MEQVLTALEVDDATRQELLALARVANAEYQDVRASVRRGLHHRQRELAALEATATLVRHFLPTLITGLLQTPEYMRAAMTMPVEPAASDVGKAIALKLERQAVLHDKAKSPFHTFVTYDRRLVTIELFTGRLVLRDPKDIDYYSALFDFFGVHALWAHEARTVLATFADTFRTTK